MSARTDDPLGIGAVCYYCQIKKLAPEVVVATVHDRRGCVHVCAKHAKWRMTTSFAFGHSPDCPMAQVAK